MAVFAQTNDCDLLITKGQLVLVTDVAECAAIELRNKFLFVLGEWFLDTREGVPYFQKVLVKNPDVFVIRSIFSQIIRNQQGVKALLDLTVKRTTDRKATFSFRAQADNGKIITGGSGQAFIVEGGS